MINNSLLLTKTPDPFLHGRHRCTHLVSDEIHLTVLTVHVSKGTLLLVKLVGATKKHNVRSEILRYTMQLPLWELLWGRRSRRGNWVSEWTVPRSPHRRSRPHNQGRTRVSFGTQGLCAPLRGSFSQTACTGDKWQSQTDTAPNDSGNKTIYWNDAVNNTV